MPPQNSISILNLRASASNATLMGQITKGGPLLDLNINPSGGFPTIIKKIQQQTTVDPTSGNIQQIVFYDAETDDELYTYSCGPKGLASGGSLSASDNKVSIRDVFGTLQGTINMNFSNVTNADTTSSISFTNIRQKLQGSGSEVPVAISVLQNLATNIGTAVQGLNASDTGGVTGTGQHIFTLIFSPAQNVASPWAVMVGSGGKLYFDDYDSQTNRYKQLLMKPNAIQDRPFHAITLGERTHVTHVADVTLAQITSAGGVKSIAVTIQDTIQSVAIPQISQNGGVTLSYPATLPEYARCDVNLGTDSVGNLTVSITTDPSNTVLAVPNKAQNPFTLSTDGLTLTGQTLTNYPNGTIGAAKLVGVIGSVMSKSDDVVDDIFGAFAAPNNNF